MTRSRRGFTIAEVLVATVLLGLVLGGLHQAHLQQRRFTDWQQRVVTSNDGFRVANSVLSAELREAVIPEGDVVIFAPDSMAVRSPLGFAVVCDRRTNPPIIALSLSMGGMPAQSGDSVLVYTSGGWRALEIVSEQRPDRRGLRCPYGNSTPEFAFRLDRGATDAIAVGSPVRVFRSYRYHPVQDGGATWLARTDALGTEPLVGPLASNGLRFRLMDSSGQATSSHDEAVGVELQLVMQGVGSIAGQFPDTLLMLFQGRNR